MSITLQELDVAAGSLLNEKTSSAMWDNTDLKVYAKLAFDTFQRTAVRRDPNFAKSDFEFVYPAGATEHEIPLTELDPASITSVRDRTDSQPGTEYAWTNSHSEIEDAQEGGRSTGRSGSRSATIFVDRIGDNLRFKIGPTPSIDRTLSIAFQQTPANFISHPSMKTGLPDPYDRCVILEVCRLARVQEQNIELADYFAGLLREAKIDAARLVKPLKRASARVRYDPDDYQ